LAFCHAFSGDAFFETQLELEAIAAEAERSPGLRANLVLEIVNVAADRLHRFFAGIVEIAEQMDVVERREGAREIAVDE
jgi:hypothetical protein